MMIRSTGALLLFAVLSAGQAITSDVASRGSLLDRLCHVSGDSLNKHVVFKARVSRGFWYSPGRSLIELFVIRSENCHATTVGKIMTLAFKGTEEAALPGHLKVTEVSASQLGIALPDTDSSGLLKPGISYDKGRGKGVTGNDLELPFGTYAVTTPEALRTRSVIPGDYEATATFELTYHQQNFCTGYFR